MWWTSTRTLVERDGGGTENLQHRIEGQEEKIPMIETLRGKCVCLGAGEVSASFFFLF